MISHLEVALQLILAAFLGGLVGLERERKNWFAGLRTHMLVCIGATLTMIVSQYGFENIIREGLVVLDPSRVAAQVVSGIGFLGAGTIIFWKNKIKGLTTAASLWAVAAVGLAIGGSLYLAATFATVLIVVTLACLKPLEKRFLISSSVKEIALTIQKDFSLHSLDKLLKDFQLHLIDLNMEKAEKNDVLHLSLEYSPRLNPLTLVDHLRKIPGIQGVEIIE